MKKLLICAAAILGCSLLVEAGNKDLPEMGGYSGGYGGDYGGGYGGGYGGDYGGGYGGGYAAPAHTNYGHGGYPSHQDGAFNPALQQQQQGAHHSAYPTYVGNSYHNDVQHGHHGSNNPVKSLLKNAGRSMLASNPKLERTLKEVARSPTLRRSYDKLKPKLASLGAKAAPYLRESSKMLSAKLAKTVNEQNQMQGHQHQHKTDHMAH